MEKEISRRSCPQCNEQYSVRRMYFQFLSSRTFSKIRVFFPYTVPELHQRHTRCGLPLTLLCGHGVCYHCVMSRRSFERNGSNVDLNKFVCKVCSAENTIQLEALHQDVLGAVNWCQLGLVRLEELKVEVAGDTVRWKSGNYRWWIVRTLPSQMFFFFQIQLTGCLFPRIQKKLLKDHLV